MALFCARFNARAAVQVSKNSAKAMTYTLD
jgi:hypothetical protein